MAGLETVVRPVVFPNIRPRPKPSLPPQDDPTKGFAEIKGNPAQSIGMSFSQSIQSSKSKPVEIERRVDVARVYQEEDDGTVNKDNFVDIEVANRIKSREPGPGDRTGDRPTAPGGEGQPWSLVPEELKTAYYKKIEEWEEGEIKKNIEIRERNKVLKKKQE